MDIAQYLAVIDRLCSRAFPAEHGGADADLSGPGYFVAGPAPGRQPATGDPAERAQAAEDVHAWKEALAQRLSARWGEEDRWSLLTLVERMARGEEIPQPWAVLTELVDDVSLWRAEPPGRWIALGVADRDPADGIRLLITVTTTDPP
ncbi:hypothetical protein [Streptomyces griseosporeus]|jgi:hypothetical protein|uniref:hypothetical protein n=1 Tax=Streptomyces griseosporeus TaxID=1910 RepID=UPI003681F9C7